MENPYEWSTDQLLHKFMNACGNAGFSNSGVVFSPSAGQDMSRAHYLCSVVRARIDQAIPPIKPGSVVKPKNDKTTPLPIIGYHGGERKLPERLTVAKVLYLGSQQWTVYFLEKNHATAQEKDDDDGDRVIKYFEPLRFKAEDFEVLEPVAV